MKSIILPSLPRRSRGSILVVLLVFLGLISLFSLLSARTVLTLQRELKLIESRQLLKYQPANAVQSSAPR